MAAYLQATPPNDNKLQGINLNDNETMLELKASLPRNFFSKEENANLWLLMMKVYFSMNHKNKILGFLNKMDSGQS